MRGLAIPVGLGILVASYFLGSEVLGNRSSGAAAAMQRANASSQDGPEAQLAAVIDRIENNQLDEALAQAEALTDKYPSFRLGQLIKGDLLLARVQPISTMGNAAHAPADKLADLREEAIVRLRGYRTKPPPNAIPRNLLQMLPEQKYAVVVDAQRSRLYLYQNDNGTPKFVTDYYITQGKLGADKYREGDKKTPIGVYQIVGNLPREKLGDFYGIGAWPINYPNDWDRRQGRDGHGIWLHGTPSNTWSRPPKASDGCVVLANHDLDMLSKNFQIGLTPVIISPNVEWLSPEEWQNERKSLADAFDGWRKDWESRDPERYAGNYSHDFKADGLDFTGWTEQKRKVNAAKSWIAVNTEKVTMFRYPGKDDMAVVTFQQDYKSNNLSNVMQKRQYWMKENGHWKIIYEGAA